MKTPGLKYGRFIQLMGIITLTKSITDVKAVENLVGQEGMGWTIAKFLLTHERTTIAGVADIHYEINRLKSVTDALPTETDKQLAVRRLAGLEVDLMALEYTNFRTWQHR